MLLCAGMLILFHSTYSVVQHRTLNKLVGEHDSALTIPTDVYVEVTIALVLFYAGVMLAVDPAAIKSCHGFRHRTYDSLMARSDFLYFSGAPSNAGKTIGK
eukprot:TRINITY_DN1776_c0_g1_i2.p1 TRINITY_DN1776_c0_g1~~TRINITY_DN1776_c0_g1_i2.p1  ORF type:complete len:101 (-),score=8.44 TRINITY_DN1776_c0_g1_i2:62-364(-)